jgi:hypothetical protein
MMQQGFVTLKAPAGQVFTDVSLASGRRVKPNADGCITVAQSEANPLLQHGWQIVQPQGPR